MNPLKTLSSRVITRLRALIVLPTRDLVTQVRETIEVLSKGTGLKVCMSGHTSYLLLTSFYSVRLVQ